MTASNHPQQTIVLVISPAPKPGRFLGYVGDELIVTSRQPFLDGDRALLARGYDPATLNYMRHANSEAQSFVTTTIGHAAGLSVVDAAQGYAVPQIRSWRGSRVGPSKTNAPVRPKSMLAGPSRTNRHRSADSDQSEKPSRRSRRRRGVGARADGEARCPWHRAPPRRMRAAGSHPRS
jgi:hypothetical protein